MIKLNIRINESSAKTILITAANDTCLNAGKISVIVLLFVLLFDQTMLENKLKNCVGLSNKILKRFATDLRKNIFLKSTNPPICLFVLFVY